MSNTGYLGYRTLVQIDLNTGLPTGITKLNLPSDPDYIPPVLNTTACPLPTENVCDSDNPVFFTPADAVVTIAWTEDRQTRYGAGIFQAWIKNTETGKYEKSYPPMRVDLAFPNTTEYYYDNSGGEGYIIIGKADTCPNVITDPPPDNLPPTLVAGQSLPNAVVGQPYFATIYFDGTLPFTSITDEVKESWATYAIDGNSVTITGTPTADGSFTFSFTINNAYGSDAFSGTLVVNAVAPPASTIFGIINGSDDTNDVKIKVVKAMGLNRMRGARCVLSTYRSGDGSLLYQKCMDNGIKLHQNFNWSTPPNAMFCHDEVLYKSKLNMAFDDFGDDTSVVEVRYSENEPDNAGYYIDTMANYITQLGWFIEVCMERGISSADGCMHLIGIMQLVHGGSGGKVGQIINGINNLRLAGKVLDYVNIHTNLDASGGSNNVRDFVAGAAYLRTHTGIPNVISNEWHIESNNIPVVMQAMDDCRTAGMIFSIPYGGKCPFVPGKAYPFNCGLTLTDMGIAIKNKAALP